MQLNLTNITYTYPRASNTAVGPVTATFPQGWTGIVGDNGCGKTTLARLACGLGRGVAGVKFREQYFGYAACVVCR